MSTKHIDLKLQRIILILVCFVLPYSLYSKKEVVGQGRYELYGIEGSVFNSMEKDDERSELIKKNHYKVKRSNTPTYNFKGKVVKLDTNFIVRPLYVLRGTYGTKTGSWIVFEYPDQSVIYRRAHRAVFEADLNDITDQVLSEQVAKQESEEQVKRAYSRVIKAWLLYQIVLTALLLFLAYLIYNAIRSNLAKRYSEPFKGYFEKLGLNLIYALPKKYIHEVTRRTGKYSGTVTGNYANLSEGVSVERYTKKTIFFSLSNESQHTDFSLAYHKSDDYGKITNSDGFIRKHGVRPKEPFAFVLIQPEYPKKITIDFIEVRSKKEVLSSDQAVQPLLTRWPWLHETIGIQRLLFAALMIFFGLVGFVAFPLFTKMVGGPLVDDPQMSKTGYFSFWIIVAGVFAAINLLMFLFTPKYRLNKISSRLFIVFSIGSLGFPFIVMLGYLFNKINKLVYMEPIPKKINPRDNLKGIFVNGLFGGPLGILLGLFVPRRKEEVDLRFNSDIPCNNEDLEV